MSSAAWYTNKRRVLAEASLTKTEYPGRIEKTNPLLPVRNCSPDYAVVNYIQNICCNKSSKPAPPVLGCILDGGDYSNGSTIIIDGNGSSNIFDGNGECAPPLGCILDGGDYSNTSTVILDGSGSSFVLDGGGTCLSSGDILDGGDSFTNSMLIFDGGNATTESTDIFDDTN